MANYSAKIDVILSGLRELSLLEDRLEKIGGIINTLNKTPVALNVGGRGQARDLSGKLSKEVNDYVREWVNGNKNIGKSINAVQQQAAAFNQLLRETAMVQQDPKAKAAVENLAAAWADTTRAATQYDKKLNDIQRKALGLQPQAIRDLEVARRQTFVSSGGKAARREQATFLAGQSASQFPFGPNPASTRRRFEGDTSVERAEKALVAKEKQTQRALNAKFFAEEKAQVLELDRLRATAAQKQTQRIQTIGKTVRGSLSSAAIGGAFPLLFGQSPQAAVGGALGGLLGGAGGGFAGSLIGTALGELEAAKARTKELAVELGLTSTQAKTLATAFELAGRNSQQLEAAVTNIQGLGLSTQETASAIKIAVELSKEYGGSVEKIAQSFADTLESGKVSIATLNKFTAQGIPIQDELAKKFGVSRTKLLEMAKDGQISVQQVTDVLVKMGQEAEKTADKGKTGFDRFTAAVQGIATAIAGAAGALLKTLIPALDTVLTRLSNIITRATLAINLITDAQVGEASAALFRSGVSRGTLTANKGNIDDLTQGLKSLQPLSAKTKEQFDLIADTAQRYRVELSKYGGALGEYAVGTAQAELTRVQKDLNAARKAVGAAARPDAITGINVPANLPPSGGGAGRKIKSNNDAERERERVAKLVKDQQFIANQLGIQAKFAQLIADAELSGDLVRARQLQTAEELVLAGNETARLLEEETNRTAQLEIARARMAKAELTRVENALDITKIQDEQQKNFDVIISDLQLEYDLKFATTEQVREQLRLEAEIAKIRGDKTLTEPQQEEIIRRKTQLAKPKTEGQKIEDRIGVLKDDLKELTSLSNQVTSAAAAIGDAFQQAFMGLVSGAMTGQQALAAFFQGVGDHFMDMASKMIAKLIEIWVLETVLGFISGSIGGGGFGGGGFGGNNAFSSFDAGGAFAFGGGGLQLMAEGGFVTGPTNAIIGEGGESEYVIPASKMDAAMSRYSRGARGEGVIAGSTGTEAGAPGAAAGPMAIDVRYSVERINNVEYVTTDQFQQGMQQAATQGAQRGEQRALRSLQQSTAVRNRVGIR